MYETNDLRGCLEALGLTEATLTPKTLLNLILEAKRNGAEQRVRLLSHILYRLDRSQCCGDGETNLQAS